MEEANTAGPSLIHPQLSTTAASSSSIPAFKPRIAAFCQPAGVELYEQEG